MSITINTAGICLIGSTSPFIWTNQVVGVINVTTATNFTIPTTQAIKNYADGLTMSGPTGPTGSQGPTGPAGSGGTGGGGGFTFGTTGSGNTVVLAQTPGIVNPTIQGGTLTGVILGRTTVNLGTIAGGTVVANGALITDQLLAVSAGDSVGLFTNAQFIVMGFTGSTLSIQGTLGHSGISVWQAAPLNGIGQTGASVLFANAFLQYEYGFKREMCFNCLCSGSGIPAPGWTFTGPGTNVDASIYQSPYLSVTVANPATGTNLIFEPGVTFPVGWYKMNYQVLQVDDSAFMNVSMQQFNGNTTAIILRPNFNTLAPFAGLGTFVSLEDYFQVSTEGFIRIIFTALAGNTGSKVFISDSLRILKEA